ncbi:unnamed protein product [Auanema sp. JU1783]|nr:unnamed protein product [Auanema sp. JU1783]
MGCRLTRTDSTELCEKSDSPISAKNRGLSSEKRGLVTNGNSSLHRRDTPHRTLDVPKNGSGGALSVPNKPIGEIESASQADFFRMLDYKIQNGPDLDSEFDD